jgi:hypothetical protein
MTTTTYQLPILPGEMVAHHRKNYAGTDYAGFYVEGEIVWVPVSLLVEVKPPLPTEPPVGAVVRADFKAPDMPDIESWVFEHGEIPAPNGNSWCGAGRDEAFSWAEICALGTPVRLVPAPEPVELPWNFGPVGVDFDSYGLGFGPHKVVVKLRGEVAHVTGPVAREMARALNTAADQAEATS